MFPKTVLFPCNVNVPDREMLAAVEFCRNIDAHLTLLLIAIAPMPPLVVDSIGFPDVWIEQDVEARSGLSQRRQTLMDWLKTQEISFDVGVEYCQAGFADAAIGLRARYADLVVVAKPQADLPGLRGQAISGALFDGSRPVLLFAANGCPIFKKASILVAWDGGIPAGRAVVAALPVLQQARAVCVLCVDPNKSFAGVGEAPGWDLAQWLTRHGVKLTVTSLPGNGGDTASVVEGHAREIGADLIVAGAYGHSRFRQRLFGGTTSKFISDSNLPVLMAH